jgi:hypothetical protein
MMQKFRVSSIDIKRVTMRVCTEWVNERSPNSAVRKIRTRSAEELSSSKAM